MLNVCFLCTALRGKKIKESPLENAPAEVLVVVGDMGAYAEVPQGVGSIEVSLSSLYIDDAAADDSCGATCDSAVDHSSPGLRSRYRLRKLANLATTNLINDEAFLHVYRLACRAGIPSDADGGLAMVKLVKFWICTISGILLLHPFARYMGWENDNTYTLNEFLMYDFHSVLLDMTFFFIVGRLHDPTCKGIDSIFPWALFVMLGSLYPSIANYFKFLRHSVSMYDIHCGWPAILFIYAFVLLVGSITFILAMLHSHHRRMVLRSRIVEVIVLFCLFFLPYAVLAGNALHLHHWFVMWWLGMLSNAPEWWARSFQAYALGSYINGIAVYGRDPILECKHAFYSSTSQQCAYMECYSENIDDSSDETEYKEFVTADWRLCDAETISNQNSV